MRLTMHPRHLGRRGAFLLFLALLDFVYAYSLFAPTRLSRLNPTSVLLTDIAPLWSWGLLWAGVGVIAMVFAFCARDAFGYAVCFFLKVLWGSLFLIGWLAGEVERGYLSAAIWLALAAVVAIIATWPDPAKVTP